MLKFQCSVFDFCHVSFLEQEVTIFGVEGGSYQLMLAWLPGCIFKLLNIDETSKVLQFH